MTWTAKREGKPGCEVLVGQHVRLEPVVWPEPAGELARCLTDVKPDAWRHMVYGPFEEAAAADAFLRRSAETRQVLALRLPDGMVAGTAAFVDANPDYGTLEIGAVVYAATLARSRASTEAMLLMLGHIFDDFGWRRIQIICDSRNAVSFEAGRRFGFQYEGVLRQHRWVKGANRDTKVSSMLDSEWPRNKAALEAWLADDNFDTDGQQKRKLESFRR